VLVAEWMDEAIVEFISLYEKHPCLHDISRKEYCNKNLKRIVEADITEKLQKTAPFTNYFVKRDQLKAYHAVASRY